MSVLDVRVDQAMYCIDCDTVTNAKMDCPRCASHLVPLSRWFTPINEKTVAGRTALYKIKRGYFEEEDRAYSFVDLPDFQMVYLTPEEAFTVLVRNFTGLLRLPSDAMWNRVAHVESSWTEPSGSVWGIIRIEK
jgi:hypothetical protein